MPMSRFSGGTKVFSELTTRPSMLISPEVGFSKPAIIRSMVVLPQPEGPSRVMNSLSWNTSLNSFRTTTSPKALVTCLMVMVDTVIYPLMSACNQMENSPLVSLFSSQLAAMTSSRMAVARAAAVCWLWKVW